ncbi:hypothetical protein HAZT_HAZT007857 [Hyalella azteca]|uniref:Metallo-beta-lactamase domain-containing protein 1 n=1 Tax=Hyalella azteca TaxID=294128 RepID=A0A6A0H0J3_HYAAZ|nr:hypothetical protein HAZT_HAZT007857 [Hyalella azteca]
MEERVDRDESDHSDVALPRVDVLYDGYSYLENGTMKANCSCVLIKGEHIVIVDTMTAWDKDNILKGLEKHQVGPDDVSYAIATHGHSDHVGNHNLFTKAVQHIVSYTVSCRDAFYLHPFDTGAVIKNKYNKFLYSSCI